MIVCKEIQYCKYQLLKDDDLILIQWSGVVVSNNVKLMEYSKFKSSYRYYSEKNNKINIGKYFIKEPKYSSYHV